MFEYIVTAFKVVISVLTAERLAIAACIILGVLLLWILFSLLFSFQSKFSRSCRKISMLVDKNGLTAENYPKFIELASKLPDSFLRGWKTFEHSDKGLPSEYLKRSECLDLELTGGLFNQNRSVMRTYIYFFTILLGVFGLGIGGDAALTTYVLAESLFVPFLFAVLCMLAYYLYTAIRQHQYRIAVEDFNEMVDILNEKVENCEIEFAKRNNQSSVFVKNVVEPAVESKNPFVEIGEILEPTIKNDSEEIAAFDYEEYEDQENAMKEAMIFDSVMKDKPIVENKSEEVIYDHLPSAGNDEKVEKADKEEKNENPIEKVEPIVYNEEKTNTDQNQGEQPVVEVKKKGRGRPKKEKMPEGELIIKDDKQFEEVLARAEKLMKKNEEALSVSQQKRVEKALKELVDAMKKYKEEN